MSGLEIVAPLAGRAAAPIVSRLAAKLVKSVTLRLRVARKVRTTAGLQFPNKPYRKWLKQVNVQDLTAPVESGGPGLALDLDKWLSNDPTWRDSDEHHSAAIRLVESTYDAMIALVDQTEANVLRDHWARARHEELVYAVSQALTEPMRLSPSDEAQVLRRASAARRHARLAPFDVDNLALAEAFHALRTSVPVVASGQTTVLIGPFGSGKSELAEEWFLSRLERIAADVTAARPLWLHARELRSASLETVVARTMTLNELTARGAAVVVDGLDEVEAVLAARIASDAKVFTETYAKSSALLTCRPDVLQTSDDQILFDGLRTEDATLLIERVAGSARVTWSWNPLLADAVRRPFFALAAATAIREGERPAGQADLITHLVQRALGPQSSASAAVRSSEIYALLIRMAIEATRSQNGSDGLTFQERQQVRTSTLVHERGDDQNLEFTLPIFQQWFAAQGVFADPATAALAIASPESFDRWRWALAIAGIASDDEQLDSLFTKVFAWNPGAGSWLLARISEGHDWFRSAGSKPIDPEVAKTRLLRATRAVVSSIGPLAPMVFPISAPDDPIVLGVRTDETRVSTGWLQKPSERDKVVDLPADVGPFRQNRRDWAWERSGEVPDGAEWPWLLPLDRVASSSLDVLNANSRLGPEGGVWRRESAYSTARRLLHQQSVFHEPISRKQVLAEATALLQRVPEPKTTLFRLNNRDISGPDLLNLVAVLKADESEKFGRLVPRPDFPKEKARSGWIWDFYSDEQLQHFYAETYGYACLAYDEAVSTVFSTFGWALGTGAAGDFGVIANLEFHDADTIGTRRPVITSAVIPLATLDRALENSDAAALWSSNRRAAVTLSGIASSNENWITHYLRQEGRSGRFTSSNPFARGGSYSTSIADASSHSRPASLKAAGWLWVDLKALDLGKGTFPQLEH